MAQKVPFSYQTLLINLRVCRPHQHIPAQTQTQTHAKPHVKQGRLSEDKQEKSSGNKMQEEREREAHQREMLCESVDVRSFRFSSKLSSSISIFASSTFPS
jgi:hypothetical protein